jgi:hypothetical protein
LGEFLSVEAADRSRTIGEQAGSVSGKQQHLPAAEQALLHRQQRPSEENHATWQFKKGWHQLAAA